LSGNTYNGNGDPTSYQGKTLAWDLEDRLTSVPSTTGGALTATYGPDGLRATKTATPVGGSASVTSYFLYDGETPLLEETASGQVLAADGMAGDGWRQRYYPGTSSLPAPYNQAPYAASGGGGQYYAYTYDPQGSLVQRQAEDNGQSDATDTVAYDGYGSKPSPRLGRGHRSY
jgi:hypothetical protein